VAHQNLDAFKEKTAMQPFIGQIQTLPYTFAPVGWAPCDGRTLPIMQYQALFSLLGTTFGGDGQRTFALPKLAAPASGVGYFIALEGVYPNRS
jgi:microcystin-dependent protein